MIRSASIKHLDEIVSIEDMMFTNPWSRKQIMHDINLKLASENLVYIKDRKVIAYMLGIKVADEFHLNNIAVHKKFQRKHIAKKLLFYLVNRLQIQDVKKIFLEVSARNKPARRLYESFGFEKEGRRENYYAMGDHAILYYLNLAFNG